MDRTEREWLLAKAARLYYEQNKTQSEIGRLIGASHATVSRLLDEAREAGIVEIIIHSPWKTSQELESELIHLFSLRRAIVLTTRGQPLADIISGISELAARYLDSVLSDDTVLGLCWGMTVWNTTKAYKALHPQQKRRVTVVQMIGSPGTDAPANQGPNAARLLAEVFEGEHRYLPTPLAVKDPALQQALLRDPAVEPILDLARHANIALVGIGAPLPRISTLLRFGYLSEEDLAQLRSQGAVGEVAGIHYDIEGRVMDIDLNRRTICIEPEAVRRIPEVIGVAGGKAKADAILGALRGQYLDVLVTDDVTAQEVLRRHRASRP
jgi:DNA-binding transcriptional regulator LsrR (DeoR family)